MSIGDIIMKEQSKVFYKECIQIALPIAIQSLFQSSLGIIDQMMVGSLGSISIAGIGLGSKFASLFTVTVTALCMGAGILMAQYYGAKENNGLCHSFSINTLLGIGISIVFTVLSLGLPNELMGLYSKEISVIEASSQYLRILAISFMPLTITLMFSTLLRSIGEVKLPMYASICSVIVNTGLNYILIYGKLGSPVLGIKGAAIATTLARSIEMLILLVAFMKVRHTGQLQLKWALPKEITFVRKAWHIIYPIVICEFLWGLGENIYASIYGRLGTVSCAAMTLTGPIQSIVMGILSGIATATGIMIGKRLGAGEIEEAYEGGKCFMKLGILGALVFSFLVVVIAPFYSQIFHVETEVREVTIRLLNYYAIFIPVKVFNMVAEGGILRSGGKTYYTLIIDSIGTWGIGIPLGLIAAYVLKLPIEQVYFMLSLEEVVRLIITLVLFKQRKWMNCLTYTAQKKVRQEQNYQV